MPDHTPAISDYAIIGNGQSAALISRTGSIDWCCWPRFDSPAVFCKMLDPKLGGSVEIRPRGLKKTERHYLDRTNVLVTRFETETGQLELTDLMPSPEDEGQQRIFPHQILRRLRCLGGKVELEIFVRPTFDYARRSPKFEFVNGHAIAYGEAEAIGIVSPVPLEATEDRLTGHLELAPGEEEWLIITHGPQERAKQLLKDNAETAAEELNRTTRYWREWADQCSYSGIYEEQVLRSALALKLLVFQPTGGLIAAPTTSIPDEIGGVRNWDYRYTWLRDSGLVLDALQLLGYHDESMAFIRWLERFAFRDGENLRVVYSINGSPAPDESNLDHLAGFWDTQPVRIGNGAVTQLQIDVNGHVLDAIDLCFMRMPRELDPNLWEQLSRLASQTASTWMEKDHGPWEMRKPPAHYLYSKLYCWIGLRSAVELVNQFNLPGPVDEWKRQAKAIQKAILDRGYNSRLKAFTQTLDGDELDASALTLSLAEFLPATDERMESTIDAIDEHLGENGLIYRYSMDDNIPGRDATFTLCSFWMVMNEALLGRTNQAHDRFSHICSFANDVGLLSEQIDVAAGALRGNFPQGFSHLGLIRAALRIDEAQREEKRK